jgi:AbrB family transcriptional regulator (stage V sporulation protein T)
MKATGIVRRIDDLGRVVIPKEIRRTMRIREGDPLELFFEDGRVLLKKYSPVGELLDFAQDYTDSLNKTSGHISIITDRDSIIAVSGLSKRDYLQKSISTNLEKILDDRHLYLTNIEAINIINEQPNVFNSMVVAPIVVEGDIVGSVILTTVNINVDFGEVETKLAQNAASFLGKQMED